MNDPLEKPTQWIHLAPMLAVLSWAVLCGVCFFTILFLPKQIIEQLPDTRVIITIPATTTPQPSKTSTLISSITPTPKIRKTHTQDVGIATPESLPSKTATLSAQTKTSTQQSLTSTSTNMVATSTQGLPYPSGSGISLSFISSPISPGELASLSVLTNSGSICQISFISPSGNPLVIEELTAIRADTQGKCTWSWLIPANIETGDARVAINIAGVSQIYIMVITNESQLYP